MDISVVLSTYNRCEVLQKALESLVLQQAPGIDYEIVVVDNNSTDATKETVDRLRARDPHFRYVFEPRQGLSYGRNAGIEAAQADVIAFTDDDVEVAPDWILQIHRSALKYPDAEFLGGRVLPNALEPFPVWAHSKMAPLALQDLDDQPVVVSSANPRCLIGACLIVRRRALSRAGLFNTETQRVKEGVGSMEDADWEGQVWSYGGHGVYVPDIIVRSELSHERLTKQYHRKWHVGHGRFNAKMRHPEWGGTRRFMDVPFWVYRRVLESTFQFAKLTLQGKHSEAFEQENSLMFCIGFIAERWKKQFSDGPPKSPTDSPAAQ